MSTDNPIETVRFVEVAVIMPSIGQSINSKVDVLRIIKRLKILQRFLLIAQLIGKTI